MTTAAKGLSDFDKHQKFVILLLAFLQFTVQLDFSILAPLGAIIMPALKISAGQFGLLVSGYAFAAGISGFLTAGFADKFDRKFLLMIFYAGFLIGTFLCALADSFEFLLFARVLSGLFGGVVSSIIFTIAADLFPLEQRGRVIGTIQSSWGASVVFGLPLGLYLSGLFGWHSIFYMNVYLIILVGFALVCFLEPITEHLARAKTGKNAFRRLFDALARPRYLQAYATAGLVVTGSYMLMPFGSAYSVNNLGLDIALLPVFYIITGGVSLILSPRIGKLSDKIGKFKTFTIGTCIGMVMIFIYTHLGVSPFYVLLLVTIFNQSSVAARLITGSALGSAVPDVEHRGAFMSVNSSLQQVSGGIAAGRPRRAA